MGLSDVCAYAYGTETPTNSTWVTLDLDTEVTDTDDFHDSGTNPSRMTAPATGTYLVLAHAGIVDGGFIVNRCRIRVNGSTAFDWWGAEGNITAICGGPTEIRLLSLTAGDYVEVQVFHGHASTRTCYPSVAIVQVEAATALCQLFTLTDQSITSSGTWTALTYVTGDEEFDTDGMHGATNTARITAQTAGYYLVWANMLTGTTVQGPRWDQRITLNGAASALNGSGNHIWHNLSYSNLSTQDWCVAYLDVGDYVQHEVKVNSTTQFVTQSLFAALHLGATPNLAYVYNSGNDTTAASGSGTWHELDFDSEWYDTNAGHDTSTNNSRVTLVDGFHFCLGKNAGQGSSGLDNNDGRIALNASGHNPHGSPGRTDQSTFCASVPFAILESTSGQYIELETQERVLQLAPESNLLVTRVGPPAVFIPQIIRYAYR